MLFLLFFVYPIFVRADDTSTTTNDDTQTPKQVLDATTREMSNGTGTASAPLLVATIADLKTALDQNIPSGEPALCIKLTDDIYYAFSDRGIKVNKNTVIDGDGHAILYTETRAPGFNGYYDYEHFSTGADNLTITLKNIKYGNATCPNSTWYGIMRVNNQNTNLVIENIDYDIQKGGQPFYANNETNTLTFKGKNSFKAGTSGGGYDGEFAQGFTNINFADNSQTKIYNDTYNESAFFWGPSKQVVTVGKNALVDISTSKQYLSYDGTSFNLNVQEKGQFKYRAISGTNHVTQIAALKLTGTINMDFAEDAIGRFTTEKNGFSCQDPTISVTSPNYILFDATSGKSPLGSIALNLTRKDSDGYRYPINYLKSGQKELTANMTGNRSITASTNNSGESVVYARAPQITNFSAVPTVGDDLSQITAQVKQWTPENLAAGSKINYKLATTKLYSGNNISTSTAQTSINNASSANGVRDSRNVAITTDIGKDSINQYNDLPAQTYYVYSRLEGNHVPGYTLSSLWVEQMVVVPTYLKVSLPDTLAFVTPKAGEITKENHLANYVVSNHGNVPVKLNLKSLTVNPDSAQDVALVAKCQKKKQVHLKLVAEYPSTTGDVMWGPIMVGSITGPPIGLDAYWNSDHEASLYFNGEHSVSVLDGGPYHVNYKLAVAISQAS